VQAAGQRFTRSARSREVHTTTAARCALAERVAATRCPVTLVPRLRHADNSPRVTCLVVPTVTCWGHIYAEFGCDGVQRLRAQSLQAVLEWEERLRRLDALS
jgi:hypothetical protein